MGMSLAVIGLYYVVNELMVLFIKKNENKIIGNNSQCSIEYGISCVSHYDPFLRKIERNYVYVWKMRETNSCQSLVLWCRRM
jgi:hypothetical protein